MRFSRPLLSLTIFVFILATTPTTTLNSPGSIPNRLTALEDLYGRLKILADNTGKTLNDLLLALANSSGTAPVITLQYSNPGTSGMGAGLSTTSASMGSNTGYPGTGSNTGYPSMGSNTGYPGTGSNTGYPGTGSNASYIGQSNQTSSTRNWPQIIDDLRRINNHFLYDATKDTGLLSSITTSNYDKARKAIDTLEQNVSANREQDLYYALSIMAAIQTQTNFDIFGFIYDETSTFIKRNNANVLTSIVYDRNVGSDKPCFITTDPGRYQWEESLDHQKIWYDLEAKIYILRKYILDGRVDKTWPSVANMTASKTSSRAGLTKTSSFFGSSKKKTIPPKKKTAKNPGIFGRL